VLKTHQLASEPLLGSGLLNSRAVLVAVVEFEVLLAFWLMSGLAPSAAWWVTTTTFGLFAVVAAGKGMAGESSCGCFGRVPTSPWFSFWLDVSVLLALCSARVPLRNWRTWRRTCALKPWRHEPAIPNAAATRLRGLCFGAACLGVAATLGGIGWRGGPTDPISGIGERIGNVIVVQPERIVSRTFGLAPYIDIGEGLKRGRWLVILYHANCRACESLLGRMADLEPRLLEAGGVAYVSVPPHGVGQEKIHLGHLQGVRGCLGEAPEWFIQTPLLVVVEDDLVATVASSFETLERWHMMEMGEGTD
jgi:hypothetical protein